ncbi:MAG: hypothetical protein LBP62_03185 [Clostridiales bacterium]|jgi:hypothetical protein|nr:hypothetical protein [Clostridiales bacterium]
MKKQKLIGTIADVDTERRLVKIRKGRKAPEIVLLEASGNILQHAREIRVKRNDETYTPANFVHDKAGILKRIELLNDRGEIIKTVDPETTKVHDKPKKEKKKIGGK